MGEKGGELGLERRKSATRIYLYEKKILFLYKEKNH